ncbi:hypothetical protein VTI74DRAFT_11037 [Chaetomium olivicolor]
MSIRKVYPTSLAKSFEEPGLEVGRPVLHWQRPPKSNVDIVCLRRGVEIEANAPPPCWSKRANPVPKQDKGEEDEPEGGSVV